MSPPLYRLPQVIPAGGFATVGGPTGVTVTVAPDATPPASTAADIVIFRPLIAAMLAPAGMPVAAIGRPTTKPVAEVTAITVAPAVAAAVVVVVTLATKLASLLSSASDTLYVLVLSRATQMIHPSGPRPRLRPLHPTRLMKSCRFPSLSAPRA